MIKLPAHLEKKRDELAESSSQKFVGASIQLYEKVGFCCGFDAGASELLPIIEKLEAALTTCSHRLGSRHYLTAEQALAELQAWREK